MLAEQDYPADRFEIVVVDNGSVDQTGEVVLSFEESSGLSVTYLVEPALGLSRARNRGVERATGAVVLFLDDDAFPERHDWIRNLSRAYTYPMVSAAGGDIRPVWPGGGRPGWIHDFFLSPLGLTALDLPEISVRRYPFQLWGANLSFRRECVVRHGGFPTDLGRRGDRLLSGEETALCLELEREGRKVVYVPEAAVKHVISEERLSAAWMLKRARAQGITEAMTDALYGTSGWRAVALLLRVARLAAHSAGTAGFGLLGVFKPRILCHYKAVSSWSYLRHVLGRRM